MNFKCFYTKSENRGNYDTFWPFDSLLFWKRYKQQKISTIYGTIADSILCKWFAGLKSGNLQMEDRERSSRPEVDDDKIKTLVKIIQVMQHGTSQIKLINEPHFHQRFSAQTTKTSHFLKGRLESMKSGLLTIMRSEKGHGLNKISHR